jgi:hypothetical protein
VPQDASHIFICYSSKDEAVAREVVDFLEAEALRCWISLRDVPAGQNYQETIVQAIESAGGFIFLFSAESSKSGEIKKELSLAGSMNVPVFPLRLTPILPSGALRYELATRQWIDLFPDRQKALGKLVETIKKAFDNPAAAAADTTVASITAERAKPDAAPAKKRVRTAREPIVSSGTAGFEAIRALLARHIGPIAKVFVEKAASEARSADDFCDRLAAHVPASGDRTAFRQAVRAQLSVKS